MQAALADFRFDTACKLMRMEPFAADLKFMDDPDVLERFLRDADDMREDIERFSTGLAREGASMQGAGFVRTELDAVVEEFSKARQIGALNVGKVAQYGEFLQEASLDEATRKEFGSLGTKKLEAIVNQLLTLIRGYFGTALMRFAPLDELELEPETNAWEYLNELRAALKSMQVGSGSELTALVGEDLAVLNTLADEIERILRAHDGASGEAKESFRRSLNYQMALLTVSISLFASRTRENAGTLEPYVDGLLRAVKKAKGLWALWKVVKELFKQS